MRRKTRNRKTDICKAVNAVTGIFFLSNMLHFTGMKIVYKLIGIKQLPKAVKHKADIAIR